MAITRYRGAGRATQQGNTETGITARGDLPSALAYEDEANTYTAVQTVSGSGEILRVASTASGNGALHYIGFRRADGTRVGFVGDGTSGAQAMMLVADAGFSLLLRINTADCITVDASENVVIGAGALATTATDRFLYIPTCPGVPTGAPTAKTGRMAIVGNSLTGDIYTYAGGAWTPH